MNVTFQHAGATLSGSVVMPPDGEVRARLVFLHGSGPADSGHWSEWADVFAEQGVASLSYDKPGVGGSEGDWTRQSFADRASEAVAALRFLATDISAEGVPTGVLGMSQGAWIGPHAASVSEDVAFVVALSGSATGRASRIGSGSNTSLRATASPRTRPTLRCEHGTNVTRCFEAERTTVR
jgi:alpha-beta hydrolase superfamily lysophospholipase